MTPRPTAAEHTEHADAPTREAARVMAVCNACRYCEQYCPVFPAMEQRLDFASADLNYLANLCHNCGECLYACQYSPPHEFAINVPRTLARLRVHSYEQYAWPAPLGAAFRHHGVLSALFAAAVGVAVLLAAGLALNRAAVLDPGARAAFYDVVPHAVMVTLFGAVGAFVVAALWIGTARCWRDIAGLAPAHPPGRGALRRAFGDALTLRHLSVHGEPCATAPETRTRWRRALHHATFYGFWLCFAATTVAALYHFAGFEAPYAYGSLPVVLGTLGGIGLVIGPAGLLAQRSHRDPQLTDPAHEGLDRSFLVLLLLTSVSGLALLALRTHAAMGVLLLVHLGIVLALFVSLPYGKLVHGLYRTAALLKYAREAGGTGRGTA